jgi:hypothetical protein
MCIFSYYKSSLSIVMTGPSQPSTSRCCDKEVVDARDKRGHDEKCSSVIPAKAAKPPRAGTQSPHHREKPRR